MRGRGEVSQPTIRYSIAEVVHLEYMHFIMYSDVLSRYECYRRPLHIITIGRCERSKIEVQKWCLLVMGRKSALHFKITLIEVLQYSDDLWHAACLQQEETETSNVTHSKLPLSFPDCRQGYQNWLFFCQKWYNFGLFFRQFANVLGYYPPNCYNLGNFPSLISDFGIFGEILATYSETIW